METRIVGWCKAHPFGEKHDLAYLFSSKAEMVNEVTYTHLFAKGYYNYNTYRKFRHVGQSAQNVDNVQCVHTSMWHGTSVDN